METPVKKKVKIPVEHQVPPPYPQRLQKKNQDVQFDQFLEVLKQLHINIPLLEALEQMPNYVKFLKDILAKKRRLGEFEIVALTKEFSAILTGKLPQKMGDPGSFTIPVLIGGKNVGHALCDLGASINLMPLSVYQKLGIGEARPITVTLQLADRSITYLEGKIEDVLVQVDKFIFPADFIILDYEADKEIPIILGRPFLSTGRALIDVHNGELTIRVNDQQVTLSIFNSIKYPIDVEECSWLRIADDLMSDEIQTEELLNQLEDELTRIIKDRVQAPLQPSVVKAPKLELKVLPSHLKYAYLGEVETLPVFIAADLAEEKECRLIEMLRNHKKAIGWTLADIKGISPSYCMHKINLEEGCKNSIEHQRRLNPAMKEVVKKEIIKWLDAGIIYPIADGDCLSPVQCVPKKGGITVVPNDNNELIPTRTITGWHICMDYRKLNKATKKDHFPLPFIDQMLDSLVGQEYYYLLDGYNGYNQITIDPQDQQKTTFTCPYGTFSFRRMPFGLCNAPTTFQRCMMAIFLDLIETVVEVFMDDFSVFRKDFSEFLSNLEQVLRRCEDTNLVLNWEKCHFMVMEGIVLGHKVSKNGIEVDRAKIEELEKLPPPTSVRGIRNFLGHAGFYRKFIKDFSKISKPLCFLLENERMLQEFD
ncbi:uncharacterized protein LOC111023818 [Momordica charantia]|uniref:Uncharacterized protein LOC111023818 n=1 Tax=Momordica charantia TaxID=3673 RepID=A0A6J1DV77_MOMCH|nr:uncharacterized protein LOC111023818 [Momordica charantia]